MGLDIIRSSFTASMPSISALFFVVISCFFLWPPYGIGHAIIFGSRPSDHYFRSVCLSVCLFVCLLWSPYVIGQTIIFLPCDFYLSFFLSFFFFLA